MASGPLPPLGNPPPGADPVRWVAACAAVRDYCRWHIAPSLSETITVDGPGGPILYLPTLRLTGLTSITNDGATVPNPEWTQAGMVRGPRRWSSKWRSIIAEITHGYDECPPAVAQVVTDMLAAAGALGATSVQVGRMSLGYSAASSAVQAGVVGLSTEQKRVLAPYRLELVP